MKKLWKVLVLAMVFTMSLSSVAFAEKGKGSGDGGAGGLEVNTVNFEDGGSIALGENLELTASNNICNIGVKDENLTCITVTDADGGEVGHEVVLYDDQLEKERKTDITIKLIDAVEGTTYKVAFSPKFTAKNGVALGKEKIFTVTTGAEVVAEEAVEESEGAVEEPVKDETATEDEETRIGGADTTTNIEVTSDNTMMIIIGVIAVVVVIGVIVIMKKKKKS